MMKLELTGLSYRGRQPIYLAWGGVPKEIPHAQVLVMENGKVNRSKLDLTQPWFVMGEDDYFEFEARQQELCWAIDMPWESSLDKLRKQQNLVCKYCKSVVEEGKENCKNCGGPTAWNKWSQQQ